jgi:hypothetical protein
LDPARDGLRLELVAEIAASNPPQDSPARLQLRALEAAQVGSGVRAKKVGHGLVL